jgi:hypothetical protein
MAVRMVKPLEGSEKMAKERPEKRQKTDESPSCPFGWEKLREMKDNQVEFWAGDGFNRLRIVEADERERRIHMVNQTGKITWPLNFRKLEEIHEKVHSGELPLMPYEIDKLIPTWGNYVTGLLKYFGCSKAES